MPAEKIRDMLAVIGRGGPALCNIAVTNSCNAGCDFCNFARGKVPAKQLRWIDVDQFDRALAILHQRDIRYISFFGGEPLLHPRLAEMIRMVVRRGMGAAVITNGWLLPAQISELAEAGLKTVCISIDAAEMADHEANRGLRGLGKRIRSATSRMADLGILPLAQVAMSKLIADYRALAPMLRDLGFRAVTFSYPQRAKLGSSSLAWSADSRLVKFTDTELIAAFDAIDDMRDLFPVNNPRASLADMKRHLRGETERFACYGGYKSFYLDWNYDVWRCDAWDKRMCSVWQFADTPFIRDGCTSCMADCYRDSSVMLHFVVSLADSLEKLAEGHVLSALATLCDTRNVSSLGAVMRNRKILSQRGKLG
jgi:MoaA/NifB/PqqE/SkfB family radical SAM enzyme